MATRNNNNNSFTSRPLHLHLLLHIYGHTLIQPQRRRKKLGN